MAKVNKYQKIGFGIVVDLHYRDYLVRANFLRAEDDDSAYDITLELRRKDISKWDMMDEKVYRLESENINWAVHDFIMDKFHDREFLPFIDRYEYELKCTEDGIEMDEERRGIK